MNTTTKKQRIDIQVLRGLAVIFVVLYHAKIPGIPAGYLGVDVFFVISGFLMTQIVAGGIANGTFSALSFYLRRARRLLPAAFATFFFTALLAPLFITKSEWHSFLLQIVGAVTFTSNFVLWRQAGYFDGDAALKPLLHIWSLAVEEQYYFVLPLAFYIVPRRYWKAAVIVGAVASLAACLILNEIKPTLSFYWLPTRAWELAIGSAGALWTLSGRVRKIPVPLLYVALFVVLAIPLFPFPGLHPGLNAVLVCVATLLLLLGELPALNRANWGIVAKVGNISYSLYLVHWPIFAFYNNVSFKDSPSFAEQAALITLSFVLACLMYRYVETPYRHARQGSSGRGVATTVIASSAALILLVAGIARASTGAGYENLRLPNDGFDATCDFHSSFSPGGKCSNSPTPKLLVWGDSFAMQLVSGILATSGNIGVVQATHSGCGPLLGVTPTNDASRTLGWVHECQQFNASVLHYVQNTPSVETVVLSSPFAAYVDADQVVMTSDGIVHPANVDIGVAGLQRTIESLRAAGKKVAIVAPAPASGVDIGRCLERSASGMLILDAPHDCEVDLSAYHQRAARVDELLQRVSSRLAVNVIRFDPYLCNAKACITHIGALPLYRDDGHLAYVGSQYLGKIMNLTAQIMATSK